MIKTKFGPIKNPKTGETADIVVSAVSKRNFRDFLIGGSIAMAGVLYVAFASFKNGAKAYDIAEYETLGKLNLFTN